MIDKVSPYYHKIFQRLSQSYVWLKDVDMKEMSVIELSVFNQQVRMIQGIIGKEIRKRKLLLGKNGAVVEPVLYYNIALYGSDVYHVIAIYNPELENKHDMVDLCPVALRIKNWTRSYPGYVADRDHVVFKWLSFCDRCKLKITELTGITEDG